MHGFAINPGRQPLRLWGWEPRAAGTRLPSAQTASRLQADLAPWPPSRLTVRRCGHSQTRLFTRSKRPQRDLQLPELGQRCLEPHKGARKLIERTEQHPCPRVPSKQASGLSHLGTSPAGFF